MDRRDVKHRTVVIAYVPVLHAGYLRFFAKHADADGFCVFSDQLVLECGYLKKEIRALKSAEVVRGLQAFFPSKPASPVSKQDLEQMNAQYTRCRVIMPDEDVCHEVARRYLPFCHITYDQTFLRWDRVNTLKELPVDYDRTIAVSALDREFLRIAAKQAQRSSNWWRQVGAVLTRQGDIVVTAFNRHMPTPYTPYLDGDPRNAFSKGVNIEFGTALHAEKGVICECARLGIATGGTWLYVTTFPCPPCAQAVVAAGIKRVYYSSGYAVLDGDTVLKNAGVELIFVPDLAPAE